MKIYDKLVRDNVLDIIEESGWRCSHHIAGDNEYITKLKEKVYEEIEEFFADPSNEEMGDILEVLKAISSYYNLDRDGLEDTMDRKAISRGKFEKRIILEKVFK